MSKTVKNGAVKSIEVISDNNEMEHCKMGENEERK